MRDELINWQSCHMHHVIPVNMVCFLGGRGWYNIDGTLRICGTTPIELMLQSFHFNNNFIHMKFPSLLPTNIINAPKEGKISTALV